MGKCKDCGAETIRNTEKIFQCPDCAEKEIYEFRKHYLVKVVGVSAIFVLYILICSTLYQLWILST